jgi:hypothetical protein
MITPKLIKSMIETYSGVYDISIKTRKREIVEMRFVYFFLCKNYCISTEKLSLRAIGEIVNRNHATVLHGIRQFKCLYGQKSFTANDLFKKTDEKLKELISTDSEGKILDLNDAFLVNQYWRVKHILVVEKTHSVIKNFMEKIEAIESKLSVYDESTINAIKNLNPSDFSEFQERNKLFLKVKSKLNQVKV